MNEPTSSLPDAYDRQLGALHGLPDVVRTTPSTIRTVPPLGIGGSHLFVVQTYRQVEQGDTIFLEAVSNTGVVRLAIPPAVSAIIARQRDALTAKSRSRAAKRSAEDRKAQGIAPGFMRRRAK